MRLRNTITAAGVVVVSLSLALCPAASRAARWVQLTKLSTQAAQHHPKPPAHRSPKYSCVTGSLGDELCCVWHITYPGYGFGTWTDCIVVPAVKP